MYPNYPSYPGSQPPQYGFNIDGPGMYGAYPGSNGGGYQNNMPPYPTNGSVGFPMPLDSSINNAYPYPSSSSSSSAYPTSNSGSNLYPSGGYNNNYNNMNMNGRPPSAYSPVPPPAMPSGPINPYNNNNNAYSTTQPSMTANIFPSLIAGGGGVSGYPSLNPNSNYGNSGYLPPNMAVAAGSGGPVGVSGYFPMNHQQMVTAPSLRPFQPFNPADDAAKLYRAMKGFGTDETTLIDILCRRTYGQRNEIALSFKTQYGKDLFKDVASETSGNFKILLTSLLVPPVQLEAQDVRRAIDGIGTDEADLIEILCTKTNAEMRDLKTVYKKIFNRDLEKDVAGDVSGYFKRLLVSLTAANRSEAPPNQQRAAQLAKELYESGAKRLGTDEVTFNRIFASESLAQLKMVFDEYYRLTGHDIEKAIRSEMSGDVQKAFLAIVHLVRNPSLFYAERLYTSMKGLGTHDHDLIRITVTRSEKDMLDIKDEFQRKYCKSLESFIKGDCSGDYKRALLCLVGDPYWK